MILTVSVIENYFDKFNKEMFDNKLVRNFPCKVSKALRTGGGVKSIRNTNRVMGFRISERFAVDQTTIEDIILHEMVHVYIVQNNIRDYDSHGNNFCNKVDVINRNFGRNVPKFETHENTQITDIKKKKGVLVIRESQVMFFNPNVKLDKIRLAMDIRNLDYRIGFTDCAEAEKYPTFQEKTILGVRKYFPMSQRLKDKILPNVNFI